MPMSNSKRSYLFLQGVCSPFFLQLAERLMKNGHAVSKINFNNGDAAYWNGKHAWAFRKRVAQLPHFLEEKIRIAGITDIVLFGDRRPIHRPVIELAQRYGLRIHVFEEGYFRPYWVTLEREGVNAHSLLPRDPDWYLRTGRTLNGVHPPEPFKSPFRIRAMHDLLYHAAGLTNPLFFPGYRTHSPFIAPVMYAGFAKRLALKPLHERRDNETVNSLISSETPFYLLPLQLNSDAQIRDHSDFEHMRDVIGYVMESFALHAPARSRLVIKNHPLDMGMTNYPRMIREAERCFDIVGRVDYLETGDLEALVRHALGTVTVNSTVGGVALQHGCPTVTLSDPIYNLAGLTFQGALERFWRDAAPPDPEMFDCFRKTVIRATQINGGFYCGTGIALAVKNAVTSLTAERSPLEDLL